MGYHIKDILRVEVAPALGCTEPAAVALCAAAASSLLKTRKPESIEVWVDPNIYKNGMAVTIPGSGGGCGIDLAAILGAIGGDPFKKLEVLNSLQESHVNEAKKLLYDRIARINLLEDKKNIFVKTVIRQGNDTAEAVIQDTHDSIVSLTLNGKEADEHPLISHAKANKDHLRELEQWLSGLTLEEIVSLLDEMDNDDLEFIQEGIRINKSLADYGLAYGPGLGVGAALERLVKEGLLKKDMILAARIMTSSACDARMSGVNLPAMSSAGSGNHGLTAVLPVYAVKDYIVCDDNEKALKAIALSHVITAYIKTHTGRLSAVCGCSIAAGAGASAGITYLMGGTIRHIASAIKNLVSDLAGIICDGAKTGCSLKLATAAGTAIQSALFSLHGIDVKETDGIIAHSPEDTMKNVGELSTKGMIETDRTILRIMINKKFRLFA